MDAREGAIWRAVFDNMREGVVVQADGGRLVMINPAALRQNGFSCPTEAQQVHLSLQSAPSGFRLFDAGGGELPFESWPISRARRQEPFQDLEVTIVDERRGHRWTGVFNGVSVSRGEGAPLFVTTAHDITTRKQTERALSESEEQLRAQAAALEGQVERRTAALERQARQLRQLAATLSAVEQRERKRLAALIHDDLQQLLVAARMRLELPAPREGGPDSRVVRATQLIDQALSAAQLLMTELRPPVLYEDGFAPAVRWLARQVEASHGLAVKVEGVDVDLGDEARALLFAGVRELLLNVARHAGAEAAKVEIAAADDRWVRVVVSDDGAGFDPAEVAARAEGGIGLFGLRERLAAIGGSCDVRSSPGGGTRVQLRAPLREGASDRHAAERPAELWGEAAGGGGRVRVLLVDDHELIREGVAGLLAVCPEIEVVGQAADGEEGVRQTGILSPDVVLMDVNMPRMNGIEATRRITEQWPQVRVIALSVQDDAATAASMREAGAAEYLFKGSDAAELVAAVLRAAPASS